MKRKLTAGQTSVSLPIFIQDTSSTTGGGLSGLTSGTSGLVAEYRRRGQSAWTAITLTSKTLGTWTSGGIVADGSLAGAYELDLPDAVCASGARWVAVRLRGAANMLPCLIEIELDVVDYLTARFGASDGTGVTLAANQDVRNVSGTLPAVTLAASQPNYAPLTSLGATAPAGWLNAAAFASGALNGKGDWATVGAAMTLTTGERSAVAAACDLALINQADGANLIGALADAIAADWVAGDASPLAIVAAMKADATLSTMINRIDVATSTRLAAVSYTAPDNAGIAAVKVVTDRISTGLVADGGVWQFTANMLELAPGSSGGLTPTQDQTLSSIAVALAGNAPVEPTGRIAQGGKVTAYVGDDFKVRSGTALTIPVSDPAGGLYTKLSALGIEKLKFGVSAPGKAGLVTGTVASITQSGSGASQLCTLNVEITNCGAGLPPGDQYFWQIEQEQTHSSETDDFVEIEGKFVLKQRAV